MSWISLSDAADRLGLLPDELSKMMLVTHRNGTSLVMHPPRKCFSGKIRVTHGPRVWEPDLEPWAAERAAGLIPWGTIS